MINKGDWRKGRDERGGEWERGREMGKKERKEREGKCGPNKLHTFASFHSNVQILVNVDNVLKNKFEGLVIVKLHHQNTAYRITCAHYHTSVKRHMLEETPSQICITADMSE